ncbi:DUF5134 domain-containing protein [Arthrobacter sp. MA-N2]|uniref:DUF5134 domain-containing protein n=1 Tax=Arthrobacter sp. MA-N2 TaxID=1101188 RepID=UPI000484EF59|nr:DUF5134 domain-containing protein [Arthrobacter sp. MA-N2]
MIHVFNIPAITWTLTAALLLGGSYHALQAARTRHHTDRVNNILHALMNILMAAMLWNLAPTTLLAQIAVLTGAALWFTIQAVARPEFKTLCTTAQGRLKCAYHALTMAGAALMLALMTHSPTPAPANQKAEATAEGMSMPMPATHHGMTPAQVSTPDTTAAAVAGLSHTPALLLTLVFTAAAATFLTLLLHHRRTATTGAHHASARKRITRTEHALEALGATAMALMSVALIT